MPSSFVVKSREDEIFKSPNDDREYRSIELENEIKILLISDKNTETSAAALNVMIGSLNDPEELPGLAHFCEHMLLMGSSKYPLENEYQKFLSEHSGFCNATTATDNTCFYFNVGAEYLKEALDRLAHVFLNPLFSESSMKREVNAVEAEYTMRLSDEDWRLFHLEKHLSKEGHPFKKFGSGNKQTLVTTPKELGINVNEELIKFYNKWYSSNIMTLSVIGKESLDDLEEMVGTMFSQVKNKGIEAPKWVDHPYGEEQMKFKCLTNLKNYSNKLILTFSIPEPNFTFKSPAEYYYTNLYGHEGPGSLLSLLKSKGWATSFDAGVGCKARGTHIFKMEAELTDEGSDHIDEIIEHIFQYREMLQDNGPQKWFFDELQLHSLMRFRFSEKEDPQSLVVTKVSHLQKFPFNEILRGEYKCDEWNPEEVEEFLNYIRPDNMMILLVGSRYQREHALTEPWFGANYLCEEIDKEALYKWMNVGVCSALQMPSINEFITNNFDLISLEKEPSQYPVVIRDTPLMRAWYKQDNEFFLPKMYLTCEITVPIGNLDPTNEVLKFLYCVMLNESLNEYSYAASLAGLNWKLNKSKYSMVLWLNGYTSVMDIILEKILERLTTLKIDSKKFQNSIKTVTRFFEEFGTVMEPNEKVDFYLNCLLLENECHHTEHLRSLKGITEEQLINYIPYFLSKMHLEILFYGNVNFELALKLSHMFETELLKKISPTALIPQQFFPNRVIKMESGSYYIYESEENVTQNSCISNYYQCGIESHRTRVLLQLFNQLIYEPFYDTIRTKEQLGYYIYSGIECFNGVQGMQFTIQSDKALQFLNLRIEAFLESLNDILENLPDEEFQTNVESLRASKLEKATCLMNRNSEYWSEISTRLYDFKRMDREVEELNKCSKQDVIAFYREYIRCDAPKRSKLSIYVISKNKENSTQDCNMNSEPYLGPNKLFTEPRELIEPKKILDIATFKNSQFLFPLPYYGIPTSHFKLVNDNDTKEDRNEDTFENLKTIFQI